MSKKKVAFVGGGNITRAIAAGLVASGYPPDDILISEPSAAARETLSRALPGVTVSSDNNSVATAADCVVLAVKPQVLHGVCQQLASTAQASRPLIISIAAGIRSADIDSWLGGGHSIVRIMPNQPALLRLGVSGVYANEHTSAAELAIACEIMAAVGTVVHVPNENDIDTVTVISGNGPAYFFLLIDMLAKTAMDLGIDEQAAQTLAIETAKGAAALAATSSEPIDTLIAQVRSPGGTTAAALDSLESRNVRDIFRQALIVARDRAVTLANEAKQ